MPSKIEVLIAARDKLSKKIDKMRGKVARFGDKTKEAFRKIGAGARKVAIALGIVAAAVWAVDRAFIKVAQNVEIFRTQLFMLSDSMAEAAEKLAIIREFARKSPLETEDTVQAYVRLRAVGIDPTIKQMEVMGGVAVLMNRKVADVALSMIGVEKEVLRKFGIEIDREGKKAVIQSGEIRKEVSKDMASIRGAILETWAERFPGAMEKASKTSKSKTAIMVSNVWELRNTVGEKLLPAWNSVIDAISRAAEASNKFLKVDPEEKIKALHFGMKELREEIEKGGRTGTRKRAGIWEQFFIPFGPEEMEKKLAKSRELFKELRELEKTQRDKGKLGTGKMGPDLDPDAADKARAIREAAAKLQIQENIKFFEARLAAQKMADEIENENRQTRLDAQEHFQEQKLQLKEDGLEKELRLNQFYFDKNKENFMVNGNVELGFTDAHKIRVDAINTKWNKIEIDKDKERYEAGQNMAMRFNNAMTSAATNLSDMRIDLLKRDVEAGRRSQGEAEKIARRHQIVMLAIAQAEAGAAVVAGILTVWKGAGESWYKIAMTAVTAAEITAATIPQIAKIARSGFARGTMGAPRQFLAGEDGPELVTMQGAGAQVQTASQTRNLFEGSSVTFYNTFNGDISDDGVDRILSQQQSLTDTVQDAIRSGVFVPERIGLKSA